MFGIPRRRKLPAAMRPRLDRDERIVAWSSTSDSASVQRAVVVVTNRGVWLPGWRDRLGWHEIHKATWTGSTLMVVPGGQVGAGEGYAVVADRPAVAVRLADPGDVPIQVRHRLTRSVAYSRHHPVPGGGVRVVARRVSGVDGVAWQVRYDDGTDPTDPGVTSLTADLVATAASPSGPA